MKLAILAAGRPLYSNRPTASEYVLAEVPAAKWNMSVVGAGILTTQIVVGFGYEEIQRAIPDAILRLNRQWQTSGSVGSFFGLDFDHTEPIIVTYGDIVFSRLLVQNLAEEDADVVVAWDSQFLAKHEEKAWVFEKILVRGESVLNSGSGAVNFPNAGFFLGVIKFSPRAIEMVREIPDSQKDRLSKSHMSELVSYLLAQGANVRAVDGIGQWARIEEPDELVRFILGSKADTLIRLKPLVSKSVIPTSLVFEVREWLMGKLNILLAIDDIWPEEVLVIRSSAREEDTFGDSMAGAFSSVIGVSGRASVSEAIEHVLASYPDSNPDNQVLLQKKIQNLIANGVVFTRSLGSDAPWLTVNFELSDRSDGVTSGKSSTSRTLNIFRPSQDYFARAKSWAVIEKIPSWMTGLLEAVDELEGITHYSRLDIEFGIDTDGIVHIFQVRPITSRTPFDLPTDAEVKKELERASLAWAVSGQAVGRVASCESPIFSNMTDWNPAEILGAAPRQLAISLYEELITNRIWSESRSYFGYRRILNFPLLQEIAGRPYVNVSASVESLLPAALDDGHAKLLLSFFLHWLKKNPDLHDKVEFDVVPTCLTPKFPEWKERFSSVCVGAGGGSDVVIEAYREALRKITRYALTSIDHDFELLTRLDEGFGVLQKNPHLSRGEKIQRVLTACQKYGTFPFSNLARRAFIAVTLLKDAADAGIVSSAAVDDFLGAIRTVSHSFAADAAKVRSGSISWEVFVSTYGHLRPGTYDITSPRYDSEPEKFLRPLVVGQPGSQGEGSGASHWVAERDGFFSWVRGELGEFTDDQIEDFLRRAIEGRESAKFAFTRSLSWMLEEIKTLAGGWGFSVEDISHIRIEQVLEAATKKRSDSTPWQKLSQIVEENRAAHKLSSHIRLPGFLAGSHNLFVFVTGSEVPNFVGSTAIIAKTIYIRPGGSSGLGNLNGAIVFIEAADPGFDWIFGSGIAGLVTKYGGANSHMAIRAAEFGLPAAIGIGETLFEALVKKDTIELDPNNLVLRGL